MVYIYDIVHVNKVRVWKQILPIKIQKQENQIECPLFKLISKDVYHFE